MRRAAIAAAFLLAAVRPAVVCADGDAPASTPAPTPAPGFDVSYIDRTADPCADFYQFACGGWVAKNPLPPGYSTWNRGFDLYVRTGAIQRALLEKAAPPEPARNALDQKIGDTYGSCMDEVGIEALGTKPLAPSLLLVSRLGKKADLPALLAELQKQGVDAVFDFSSEPDFKDSTHEIAWLDQSGLGLPDRDYYLKTDEKEKGLRDAYVAHVANMLRLAGDTPAAAAAGAKAVLALETALAKASADRVSRRDPSTLYHPMTRKELAALAPGFDWEAYFAATGAPAFERLSVASPDFFKAFAAELVHTPLADWKAYLRWQIAHGSAPYLTKAFVDENFAFFNRTLKGAKENRPRWQRCVRTVESDLGEALGQRFVEATVGAEGKERLLRMVGALRTALDRDIAGLAWMTPPTKEAAAAKLGAIAVRIAYPDRWRDYSKLTVERGAALANHQRAAAFERARDLAQIGAPSDKGEWPFPPTMMQAGYDPQINAITFAAAMLQPPFYENRLDDPINLGAIGTVIGHELTHGFDDQGRRFDGAGNLRDWWTAEDAAEFGKRAGCFVDQYGGYVSVGETKLDGKLTLGENIADNGGLRMSYEAFRALQKEKPTGSVDGFTPAQRFFLGFGQITCENRTDEVAAMMVRTDAHSPGRYRLQGAVSNMPEFREAFACKADAPMVRPVPCRVW
jgi:endothelin-converting enzyme/putative endopeptidase